MELCERDLFNFTDERNKPFSEKAAKNICGQLFTALAECHRQNIIHGDVKPENILLTRRRALGASDDLITHDDDDDDDDCSSLIFKLCDFGCSTTDCSGRSTTDCNDIIYCTGAYAAPEILEGKAYSDRCDVWSVGITLCFLLTLRLPFSNDASDDSNDPKKGGNGIDFNSQEWSQISSNSITFIKRILNADPTKRPTSKDCLSDPFFKQF